MFWFLVIDGFYLFVICFDVDFVGNVVDIGLFVVLWFE